MNFKFYLQIARRFHGSRSRLKAIPVAKEFVSSEWTNAKPFGEMPGPNGLPLIGNTWRLLPCIGESKFFAKFRYVRNKINFTLQPGKLNDIVS